MAIQYQIPGGPYLDDGEDGLDYMLPGHGYVNEVQGDAPTGAVGLVNAEPLRSLINGGLAQ